MNDEMVNNIKGMLQKVIRDEEKHSTRNERVCEMLNSYFKYTRPCNTDLLNKQELDSLFLDTIEPIFTLYTNND